MPKGFVFIPDKDFADELVTDDALVPGLLELAEKAADVTVQVAPERLRHYKKSISASAGKREDGLVVGRVASDDFKALWIENGTGQPAPTPAYAPLRRGVEAVVGNVR